MNTLSERIKRLVKKLTIRKRPESSHELDRKLVFSLKKSWIPTWTQFKRVALLLSIKEKRILGGLLLFILLSGGILSYLYYKENITVVPAYGGFYSEALIGQPSFINPILAQTSDTDSDITRLIYRGLLQYNADLSITTDLASDIIIDEAQTKYTITLRDDIFWQNGEAVTIDDVIFTIRAIQDPEWGSPLLISFKGVTMDKLDERTVAFNLPEPFGPFLSLLTTGILPKNIWQDIPAANARLAEFNIKPIGNGPWKFSELSKDKAGRIFSYTLVANEFYNEKPPYLAEIVFKFYPDFATALIALNQNQVMGLSFLPTELHNSILDPQKYIFNELNLPQYTALFINQKNNEFLKNKTVRTALAYAINKAGLISTTLYDQAEEISSPLFTIDSEATKRSYDPDRARELLEETGWKINEDDTFRSNGEDTLALTLTTIDQPENSTVANLLKSYWEAIGVQITVRLIPVTEIQLNVIKDRAYDILLYGAITGADPDPYPFWHSSQAEHPGLNLSLFKDGTTDALLEEARKQSDPEKRNASYISFVKILEEQVPAIFLYTPTYVYPQDKRLQGFTNKQLIIPADRFSNSTDWFTKTKRVLK